MWKPAPSLQLARLGRRARRVAVGSQLGLAQLDAGAKQEPDSRYLRMMQTYACTATYIFINTHTYIFVYIHTHTAVHSLVNLQWLKQALFEPDCILSLGSNNC